jgi:pyruvate/2-oxoglutarate dehydrogenase complex dihydrolipoamide dehydrogenase (E3) component
MSGGERHPGLRPGDPSDERLVGQVHPASWKNPVPSDLYDLVVVGAGTAGLVTAAGAAGLGARVALVERGLMGGDCLNHGCVPSKALLRAARAAADVRDAGRYGVSSGGDASVDFRAVMARMRGIRADLAANDAAARFGGLGVDVFLGPGRFTGPRELDAAGARLRFARAVVATGSRPAVPDVPGLAETGCLTNETVFGLDELPPRLAVIGGGPAGCELAQAFARFGSRVHLVTAAPRLLERDDPDAAAVVEDALRRDGIDVHAGRRVARVERAGGWIRLWHEPAEGGAARADATGDGLDPAGGRSGGRAGGAHADAILVAAGRLPNVEGLGLEAAGVAHDPRRGVHVDDHLRTTNPRIWAAGDVCSALRFTHLADALARIAIRNALFGGRARVSRLTVPWCTYTDPEVAHVGLGTGEAGAGGRETRTFVQELRGVDRALLDGETEGFVKLRVRRRGGRVLGATIVARHAGEMLPELTLAIAAGVGLGRLGGVIHSYPTQAEAVRRIADAWQRTRLTPRARRLISWWLDLRRR